MYLDQYSPTKISKDLWYNDIHIGQDERKTFQQFFIFMELELFFNSGIGQKNSNVPRFSGDQSQ